MIYFKTINISTTCLEIEKAIRSYSIKKHATLDLSLSSTDTGSDKLFLGLENDKTLKITRLRTTFERFLPKIIIKFDKLTDFSTFKIRYCLFTSFILFFLILAIVLNIYNSVISNEMENDFFDSIFLLIGFFLLTFIEIYITKSKINKAIKKYKPC